jgi:hypothetical protein
MLCFKKKENGVGTIVHEKITVGRVGGYADSGGEA